eukprot:876267-Amphidinium_carterae.1
MDGMDPIAASAKVDLDGDHIPAPSKLEKKELVGTAGMGARVESKGLPQRGLHLGMWVSSKHSQREIATAPKKNAQSETSEQARSGKFTKPQ